MRVLANTSVHANADLQTGPTKFVPEKKVNRITQSDFLVELDLIKEATAVCGGAEIRNGLLSQLSIDKGNPIGRDSQA